MVLFGLVQGLPITADKIQNFSQILTFDHGWGVLLFKTLSLEKVFRSHWSIHFVGNTTPSRPNNPLLLIKLHWFPFSFGSNSSLRRNALRYCRYLYGGDNWKLCQGLAINSFFQGSVLFILLLRVLPLHRVKLFFVFLYLDKKTVYWLAVFVFIILRN